MNDLLSPLRTEFLMVVLLLVDRLGRIGVEVEGIPGSVEGVIRIGRLVQLDSFVQTILADIAPRANLRRREVSVCYFGIPRSSGT